MSKPRKKLALHWQIIIGLALGVLWSLFASGFFGGVFQSDLIAINSLQQETHPEKADVSIVTLPVSFDGEDLKAIKVRTEEQKRLLISKRYWMLNGEVLDDYKEGATPFLKVEIPQKFSQANLQFLYQKKLYRGWSSLTMDWIDPWGTIFIRLLKMIAIPMVLFSIIMGVVGLGDSARLGRMGAKTLGMYLVTTIAAVCVGLLVVNILKPGKGDPDALVENRIRYELWVEATPGVEILDGKNYLTDPQYSAIVADVRSSDANWQENVGALSSKMKAHDSEKDKGPLQFVVDMVPDNIFSALTSNKRMLEIIFFAIFLGIALLFIPKEKSEPIAKVADGLSAVFVKMMEIVMKAAPYFVFALLAGTITKLAGDDPAKVVEIFSQLFFYSIAVVVGLGLMIFGIYPLVVRLLTKIGYGKFFRSIGAAQTMAFSTSSSLATLPVTIDCVENKLGVNKNITSFVLPIGATVNMDGTSLYQAVAVIFMAQMHDVDLSIAQQLTIVLTATLASIGAAAVPSAGLVLMMVVLESVGLNPAWIAIIFPVDRILDMCRTVVNVTGDATVSAVIAKSEGQLDVDKTA